MAVVQLPASPAYRLPAELWLQIFKLAASSPETCFSAKYAAFEPTADDAETIESACLAVKHSIVLVCRAWCALGTEMLYEDVHIHHGVPALERTFQSPAYADLQKRVRRAVLPYSQTQTRTYCPLPAVSILAHCPRLEVLVRPYRRRALFPQFEFAAEVPPLPNLKRLEWWHDNAASHTGGINALDDVLRNAPQLEYLTFSGQMFLTSLKQQYHLRLPALTTLRLRAVNAIAIRQLIVWSLPALSHLVLDDPPADPRALDLLWEAYSDQIRVAELGRCVHFLADDSIRRLLSACRGLRELNYRIAYTAVPDLSEFTHSAPHLGLCRVGMHAVDCVPNAPGSKALWEHIRNNFEAYDAQAFPALREFVLYGEEWQMLRDDRRFCTIDDMVRARGRRIVFVDW
ncbi:hypothetical protein K488DRAFT_59983 [Vararia minispora EC-137]|uniref:Uncharacterized protein n=1 Tax=Vararia minispora EC-137 TaxID=1314806 RepID=A0ACB8Q8P9_9AGAM|nr:hypothetical protein K488DRAFT_59983 [Vararia minispora EC-137]